jgi:hypothetical protein
VDNVDIMYSYSRFPYLDSRKKVRWRSESIGISHQLSARCHRGRPRYRLHSRTISPGSSTRRMPCLRLSSLCSYCRSQSLQQTTQCRRSPCSSRIEANQALVCGGQTQNRTLCFLQRVLTSKKFRPIHGHMTLFGSLFTINQ